MSQDPFGQEANGPNTYLYTADDPTNAVDLYGTTLTAPTSGPGAPRSSASGGEGNGPGGPPGGGGAGAGGGGSGCGGSDSKGSGLGGGGDWFPGAMCSDAEPAPPGYDPETWSKRPASREKSLEKTITIQKVESGIGILKISGMNRGTGITNQAIRGMLNGKRCIRDKG